mgnify:FL=1|jgi:hypothetical protein|tara:strand:- start:22 stop:234 length:213 start_codon:yes stop_codon:yes gene_type:complete
MIRVDGYQNLYRDEKSGAIINCDSMAYNQYISSLEQRNLQKREISEMKNDINEIKSLLRNLLMNSENINI